MLKEEDQNTRIGDVAAMLRVMRPLNGAAPDLVANHRRLLADLCRFIGVKVGSLPPDQLPDSSQPGATGPIANSPVKHIGTPELSPRLEQTLKLLLEGASEKQVARKLQLSPHTVHVYVKALYKRYEVSTRAELLSRHLQR